jgi:hypothetical protein
MEYRNKLNFQNLSPEEKQMLVGILGEVSRKPNIGELDKPDTIDVNLKDYPEYKEEVVEDETEEPIRKPAMVEEPVDEATSRFKKLQEMMR